MTQTDKHQRSTSHPGPQEPDALPIPKQSDQPTADEPHHPADEDLTAGSEGAGRTIGLGGSGSSARPMREGH